MAVEDSVWGVSECGGGVTRERYRVIGLTV
jgi:hypothetical protein